MLELKEVITIENEKYIKLQYMLDFIHDLESLISDIQEHCGSKEGALLLCFLKQICNIKNNYRNGIKKEEKKIVN